MKLKYARSTWKTNRTICKGIMWTTIGTYFGLLIFSLLSIYNQTGFISSYYACSGLPQPDSKTGLSWMGIFVLGFLLTTITSSVAMDLFGLWKIKTLEVVQKPPPKLPMKPERTTETVDTMITDPQCKISSNILRFFLNCTKISSSN